MFCKWINNFVSIFRWFFYVLVEISLLFMKLLILFILCNNFFISLLNVVGVFISLNGIVVNWNSLYGVENVVRCLFWWFMGIC